MPDPYLQALMTGQLKIVKDKFAVALEEKIDRYLDTLDFSGEDDKLRLPAMKRSRLRAQLLDTAKQNDPYEHVNDALGILKSEGIKYLQEDVLSNLFKEISAIGDSMAGINVENLSDEEFSLLCTVSGGSLNALSEMAIAKFDEQDYSQCLSLSILLTSLDDNNADYWMRAGIAAQELQKFPMALYGYTRALDLDEGLIRARLFAAECCLASGLIAEAHNHCLEAENFARTNDLDVDSRELLVLLMKELPSSSQ
jgi:tetratricopeptide (TPR) repeat protein